MEFELVKSKVARVYVYDPASPDVVPSFDIVRRASSSFSNIFRNPNATEVIHLGDRGILYRPTWRGSPSEEKNAGATKLYFDWFDAPKIDPDPNAGLKGLFEFPAPHRFELLGLWYHAAGEHCEMRTVTVADPWWKVQQELENGVGLADRVVAVPPYGNIGGTVLIFTDDADDNDVLHAKMQWG